MLAFASLILVASLAQAENPTPQGAENGEELQNREGPLENDTFVPTMAAVEARIEEGDALWLESRTGDQDPTSLLLRAMDLWQGSLAEETNALSDDPEQGAFGWVQALTGERHLAKVLPNQIADLERLWLSPTEAVFIRLEALTQQEQKLWRERFEPLAQEALAVAPFHPARLRWIEYHYPGTTAAATACLRLADAALESAAPIGAATYLTRAKRHLGERSLAEPWRSHLAIRTPLWAGAAPLAADWKPINTWRLEGRRGRIAPGQKIRLGSGSRPGMVVLADGTACVQTPRGLWTLATDERGIPRPGYPHLQDLSKWTREGPIRPLTPASSGGWPHLPARLDNRLFLVVDRAKPGSDRFGLPVPPRGNHLMAVDVAPMGPPSLAWLQNSSGRSLERNPASPKGSPGGHIEYQPGPTLAGSTLWVLGRTMAPVGETLPDEEPDGSAGNPATPKATPDEFIFALAFDTQTGALQSKVRLHKAADLAARDESSMSQEIATACAPLGLDQDNGQLLVQTGQGLCIVLDAVDGRPRFAYQTRRRKPRDRGWPGSFVPESWDGVWTATPFDGDRLYRIHLRRGTWPIRADQTNPMESRLALLASDGLGLTFAGQRGARQTLWTETPAGKRHLGFLFGREETLRGIPAFDSERIVLSTDQGLYVLDRARELLLTARAPIEDRGAGVGGDVYHQNSRIWVLGADTLWLFGAP